MTEREMMLKRVQMADFSLIDTGLYLDTHPDCRNGQEFFRQVRAERDAALHAYESAYGPLTVDNSAAMGAWDWTDAPWPWQTEV